MKHDIFSGGAGSGNLSVRDRQACELAGEIISLARDQILTKLRFMDRAIGNFRCSASMNYGFASAGGCLIYSPWTLLRMYQREQNEAARGLLHAILHSVFRHSFTGDGIDRQRWDLAADIAVEASITDLGQEFLSVRREADQAPILSELREHIPRLTAERIYSYLDNGEVPAAKRCEWAEIFAADSHDLWYGAAGEGIEISTDIDLGELWKDISKRMQNDLERSARGSGALSQNLRDINRVRYNYTEFLRRFGLHSEAIRLSEEEFDNNYYTYGMQLYGNIPLIEPLEYRDMHRIKEFVIAIDTSGSVQGEVVQKFIEHTHDVLSGQSSFDSETALYIIQCDDDIRDVEVIRSPDDFKRYFKTKEIKGLGQTDFRPVFDYVDSLLEEHKLHDLRGLLYFTDGKGTFPAKAPCYDTAFIIHNDNLEDVWVPDWAMKVEMPAEEIMSL